MRQGKVLAPLPRLAERVLDRPFIPTLYEDDLLVTVPVDVAKTLTMSVAGIRDHALCHGRLPILFTKLPDQHGILCVPTVGNVLGDSTFIHVA